MARNSSPSEARTTFSTSVVLGWSWILASNALPLDSRVFVPSGFLLVLVIEASIDSYSATYNFSI